MSKSSVVSVRIPDGVLNEIDKFVENSDVKISRSSAIVYLLTRGLREQGLNYSEGSEVKSKSDF